MRGSSSAKNADMRVGARAAGEEQVVLGDKPVAAHEGLRCNPEQQRAHGRRAGGSTRHELGQHSRQACEIRLLQEHAERLVRCYQLRERSHSGSVAVSAGREHQWFFEDARSPQQLAQTAGAAGTSRVHREQTTAQLEHEHTSVE